METWMVYGAGTPLMFQATSSEVAEHMAVELTGSEKSLTVLGVDIDGDILLP